MAKATEATEPTTEAEEAVCPFEKRIEECQGKMAAALTKEAKDLQIVDNISRTSKAHIRATTKNELVGLRKQVAAITKEKSEKK